MENHVSRSRNVSGEHCCLLAEAYSIALVQNRSACIQDRLDENTNTVRTQTLTHSEKDKGFVYIWVSPKLVVRLVLLEFKCCLRTFPRFPLVGDDRQTWSSFKQLTRTMIRALVHSVGKLNYTGSPLQNDADWNWHLSVRTSIQVQFDKKFNFNYNCHLKLQPFDWHQQ